MTYTWVDLLFLLFFFFSALAGFTRGLVAEVINVMTWFVAVGIAVLFAQDLSTYFMSIAELQRIIGSASSAMGMDMNGAASYLSLFFSFLILFSVAIGIGSVVSTFVGLAFSASGAGLVNRALGAVFGFGKGVLIAMVFAFLVQLTALGSQPWWQSSQVVQSLQPGVEWLARVTAPGVEMLRGKLGSTIDSVGSTLQGAVNKVTGS